MNSDFAKQLIVGVAAVCFTGLFFITSYRYEISYLTAAGIPQNVASQIAQVGYYTYSSFLTGFILLATTCGTACVIVANSSRLRKILFTGWTFLLISSITLGLLIGVAYWILPKLGFNDNSFWLSFVKYLIALLGIPIIIVTAVQNIDISSITRFDTSTVSGKLAYTVTIFTVVYWVSYALFGVTNNMATVQARLDSSSRPTISINKKTYKIVRIYNSKLLLEGEKDKNVNIVNYDAKTPIVIQR